MMEVANLKFRIFGYTVHFYAFRDEVPVPPDMKGCLPERVLRIGLDIYKVSGENRKQA